MDEKLTNQKSGRVYSVNRSSQNGMPKKPVGYGYFKLGVGMSGDAHSNPDEPELQVSLMAFEDYPEDKKETLIGSFGENITTKGIALNNLVIGSQLHIGKEVLLQIGQIGKECFGDDSKKNKPGCSSISTHGVFAYVRAEGEVSEGDEIRIVKPDL
jgi:MOSC domain-containing protein YiiM